MKYSSSLKIFAFLLEPETVQVQKNESTEDQIKMNIISAKRTHKQTNSVFPHLDLIVIFTFTFRFDRVNTDPTNQYPSSKYPTMLYSTCSLGDLNLQTHGWSLEVTPFLVGYPSLTFRPYNHNWEYVILCPINVTCWKTKNVVSIVPNHFPMIGSQTTTAKSIHGKLENVKV